VIIEEEQEGELQVRGGGRTIYWDEVTTGRQTWTGEGGG